MARSQVLSNNSVPEKRETKFFTNGIKLNFAFTLNFT